MPEKSHQQLTCKRVRSDGVSWAAVGMHGSGEQSPSNVGGEKINDLCGVTRSQCPQALDGSWQSVW
jgi:hypothetical protein